MRPDGTATPSPPATDVTPYRAGGETVGEEGKGDGDRAPFVSLSGDSSPP